MVVSVENVTVKELISAARAANIRRVLLTDYASVEPKMKKNAFVLVGMLRVVATALDRNKKVIYRWSEEGESEKMVTITGSNGRSRNAGRQLISRKQEVFQVLREEGFEVDEGEWTPASARAFLSARKKIVG